MKDVKTLARSSVFPSFQIEVNFKKRSSLDRGHLRFTFIEKDRPLNKPKIHFVKIERLTFDHDRKW